ncbi:hypothetical protein GHK58_31065 [Sinorhizobium meliloti]|uniref:Transposase n=1 Tax=Rhizobium meliloti TaxID=382 RepID=A0AAW9TK82_RHIML|nr:hypothetical protein [Sinorhizobium meliloti]MQX44462.1 hypothetical protein [Sinorhizobium meliloti]
MARALSDDLRHRVLAASAGGMSARSAAARRAAQELFLIKNGTERAGARTTIWTSCWIGEWRRPRPSPAGNTPVSNTARCPSWT